MSQVYFGLSSTEGDRLGHLVRGVQMLRSHGREADITEYSDVVNVVLQPDGPPAFACVVGGTSAATLEALQSICRETEWSLGNEKGVLTVNLLQLGARAVGQAPRPFAAMQAGRLEAGMVQVMPGDAFARLCDWGQELIGGDEGVIGEWPSATGP
jgi:hypothetical protein